MLIDGDYHRARRTIHEMFPTNDEDWFGIKDSGSVGKTLIHNPPNARRVDILWFRRVVSVPVLVHEIFHLVFNVMDLIGMTLHPSSEEAFCYYGEMIARAIAREVRIVS